MVLTGNYCKWLNPEPSVEGSTKNPHEMFSTEPCDDVMVPPMINKVSGFAVIRIWTFCVIFCLKVVSFLLFIV